MTLTFDIKADASCFAEVSAETSLKFPIPNMLRPISLVVNQPFDGC